MSCNQRIQSCDILFAKQGRVSKWWILSYQNVTASFFMSKKRSIWVVKSDSTKISSQDFNAELNEDTRLLSVYNSRRSLDRKELMHGLRWHTYTWSICTHTLQRSGLVRCKNTETNKYLVVRLQTWEAVITSDTSNSIPEEWVLIMPCCTCICFLRIICDYWWINSGNVKARWHREQHPRLIIVLPQFLTTETEPTFSTGLWLCV